MFKISIPKPCHEDWSKMSPNEQGRYCNTCAKTVVDFTTMTDHEVQNFFIKRTPEESTCGRFKGEQLGRITITLPHNVFELRMASWKKFLAVCLLAFSSMLFSCDTTIDKVENKTQQVIDTTVLRKDSTLQSKGYVGGFFTKYETDIKMEPTCTATTGDSVYYDSTFATTTLPVNDTSNTAINSIDFTGDTLLFEQADTLQISDSLIMKLPKQDSADCGNQTFINL